MSTQPLEFQNNLDSNPKLPIDVRPEWTRIDLGHNLTATACVIAGRILVTRLCGFVNTDQARTYFQLIEKVMAAGLEPDQPFIYVAEWSECKGGSVGARLQAWDFLRSRPHLRALLFCGASALMRMSIKLTQRVTPVAFDVLFCPDLDQGIHIAGKRLGLFLPDYFKLPKAFLDRTDHRSTLGDQFVLLSDSLTSETPAIFEYRLSSGQTIVFKRIGSRILFCHIKGQRNRKPVKTGDILKARRQGLAKCLKTPSTHIEVWDCTNFTAIFGRSTIRKLIKTLFKDSLPLLGCSFLDIGCQIRALVRWCTWRYRPAYPVHCMASLTMSILRAQEQLHAAGCQTGPRPPKVITRPEWQYDDNVFLVENEIVDQDIIHARGSGYLQAQHLRPLFAVHRQMALEIVGAGHPYYVVGGADTLQGGSYRARKRFLGAARKLYRDLPFQMYVIYGAKTKIRAAVNLAKQSAPFRISMADNYDNALAIIRADKMRRAYLNAPEPNREPVILPPAALAAVQPAVNSILGYLGTISWEPANKNRSKPPLASNHPLSQLFDAIDLINEDLKTIYQEQIHLEQELARSRKMEALGLLAGGVAHDLNNVLSGIVTYPDVLLMELPKSSPLRDRLISIRESGQKAAAIVQDLLTMSRRGVQAVQLLNVNTLIQDYLDAPEHMAIAKRYPTVTFQTALAADLKNINASPIHIKQTIMNLILNAVEASDQEGTIDIATENRWAHFPIKGYETIPPGPYVILQVKDQGVGIAPQDLEHIFEPFYTKKKMGRSGTGLGMAIVWGTVQDSNGYIDIESKPGIGTQITLYFPVCDEPPPIDKQTEPQDHYQGHGESILVVDDEPQQREIATAILNQLGYNPATVDSGEAALSFLKDERVDLVMMDMIMDPGMDGLETIRRIKDQYPDQKIIICTGYAKNQQIKEAQALCCAPKVQKPYSVKTMGEALFLAFADDSESTDPT